MANRIFSDEYNEQMEEQVQELLKGLVLDSSELHDKVEYIKKHYGLTTYKKCCFYGRVSTVKREQMSSIIGQHDICQDFEYQYMKDEYIVVSEVFETETGTQIQCRYGYNW